MPAPTEPGWSTETKQLIAMVREFSIERAGPASRDYESRAEDPAALYKELAQLSLTGLPFEEGAGGMGQTFSTYLLVIEELAANYLAIAIGLSVHTLCAFAIDNFGDEGQRMDVLPRLTGGEWYGAYALSEPGSGSDAASLTTKAVKDNDGYVLNGTKVFCTRGDEADVVLVMARTSDDGARGISAFLIEKGTPGFGGSKKEDKMGWRSSPTWMLSLDDVRVDSAHRLADEGRGFSVALASLDSGRLGIAACAVGLAQGAFDAALSFVKDREQFGSSVANQEGVQFMLADMATQIEAARRLYRYAAALKDAGDNYSLQAAQAKLFATDVAMKVTIDAVQLHGGYGYVTEYPVERYMREAKGLQIVEGTNQIQRYVIGRKLTAPAKGALA
jgi:alkylation response protein AidB-like acyl-CoA dehydrogenase